MDASAIDAHSEGTVTAVLTGPDNGKSACQVLSNKDGTYVCNYTPLEEGDLFYSIVLLHLVLFVM